MCQIHHWTSKGHQQDCATMEILSPLLTRNWNLAAPRYSFPMQHEMADADETEDDEDDVEVARSLLSLSKQASSVESK